MYEDMYIPDVFIRCSSRFWTFWLFPRKLYLPSYSWDSYCPWPRWSPCSQSWSSAAARPDGPITTGHLVSNERTHAHTFRVVWHLHQSSTTSPSRSRYGLRNPVESVKTLSSPSLFIYYNHKVSEERRENYCSWIRGGWVPRYHHMMKFSRNE